MVPAYLDSLSAVSTNHLNQRREMLGPPIVAAKRQDALASFLSASKPILHWSAKKADNRL